MSQQRYDIFISYRRSASEFAQLVASHLKSAGYRVFIDVESLRSGKFNTQLFDVIDSCKDFVIILPEGGIDRCSSSDDWVRMEYERAEKSGKNIVPVLLSGFSWPSPMPQGMEELRNYQGLSATSAEYYDLSIKRLRSYLRSRPHRTAVRILKWAGSIIAAILLLLLLSEGILSLASRSLYTRVADKLTSQVCVLDLLGDSNETIDTAWERFMKDYVAPEKKTFREDFISTLGASLDDVLVGLEPLRKQLEPSRIELSPWESLLVSMKDISPEELSRSQPYVETFFDDIEGRVSLIREAIADGDVTLLEGDLVGENGDVFRHCSNGYFYGYLSIISLLPEKSRTRYNQMVSKWRHFPNGVGLNHSPDEYEQFIQKEYSDLQRYGYDLSKRLLQVEQKYKESILQYDNEVSKYISLYQGVLTAARDSLGKNDYYDWLNIVMVSSFLPDLIEHESDPDHLPMPLTSSEVANDLSSLLRNYGDCYPYLSQTAGTAALFYSRVCSGALPYRGFITAAAGAQKELSAGDIVVSVNGKGAIPANMAELSEILSGGMARKLEVRSIGQDKDDATRSVEFDPAKAPPVFLPLVPFGN